MSDRSKYISSLGRPIGQKNELLHTYGVGAWVLMFVAVYVAYSGWYNAQITISSKSFGQDVTVQGILDQNTSDTQTVTISRVLLNGEIKLCLSLMS